MENKPVKACFITVDDTFLETLLQLPKGVFIGSIRPSECTVGQHRIYLTGIGPEVEPGDMLQQVCPKVHSARDGNINVIDWSEFE